jgi:tripartite-type tricarboxylate transporter receptor subunit TctC
MTSRILVAACGLLAVTAAAAQSGDPVAAFFKTNNTMRIIVSSEAGGNYDGYSRMVARHLGKFIPGNPSIVVQNMPGAAGLVAANYLYNAAPKDGTVMANVQRQVPLIQILGEGGSQFETAKFNWLGSLASEGSICVSWSTSPVKSFDDLKTQELIVGGSGQNDSETVPAILNNILGTKFKIISGYPSQTAATLAVERGEVSGVCTSYSSLLARNGHWFKDKKVNILLQAATQRHPDLPDVPLTMELASNAEDKALLELIDSRLQIGRPYVLPPDVPADRVKAIRAAFDAMVKDKDFLADAAKEKRDIDYVSGAEMQALFEKLSKTPQAMIDRLNDSLKYKGPTITAR